MDAGVYRGIENRDYHGGPGVSKSGLDLVRKSPAHYRAVVTAANDNERSPTAAQALGTALHCLVLEPAEFVKSYTLALRRSDVPEAIDDREQLVAMVQELNVGRLPKLPTSGSKAELVARIIDAQFGGLATDEDAAALDGMKGAELKARIEQLNESRQGLLSTSGTRHELADILRANGKPVTLWSDVQAEWMQNNGHRIVLSEEQWTQLHTMRDAIMAHPAAGKLLAAPGEAELSAYWHEQVVDQATGDVIDTVLCRVRPDYWRKDGIIVDLKSTEDASREGFARSIAKWRYHVQDPFYRDGLTKALHQCGGFEDFAPPRAFVFIAVEKDACIVDGVAKGVAVYTLDDDSLSLGRMEYQQDLRSYAACMRDDSWPGYSTRITQIKLPAWQFSRAAEQSVTA